MNTPFSARIRKNSIYRRSSRFVKRLFNVESVFSSRPKYPELHQNIASFPLEEVRIEVDRTKVNRVAIAIDENPLNHFYSDRFLSVLEKNSILYEIVDMRCHSFYETIGRCDALIFRPGPKPFRLDVIRDQLFAIAECSPIPTFPNFREMMLYENKRLQLWFLESLGFPHVPTFISASRQDSYEYIDRVDPPYVIKTNTGAGSSGVELIRTRKEAVRYCSRVFSSNGAASPSPHMRQKDFLLIQTFVENYGFDLRVCVVGDRVFGYFREATDGDFRASGSGKLKFGSLPEEAVRIAVNLRKELDFVFIAVDFIQDLQGNFLIIEFSSFIGHSTSGLYREQGIPGWLRLNDSTMTSEMGLRSWFPELMIKEFLERSFPTH